MNLLTTSSKHKKSRYKNRLIALLFIGILTAHSKSLALVYGEYEEFGELQELGEFGVLGTLFNGVASLPSALLIGARSGFNVARNGFNYVHASGLFQSVHPDYPIPGVGNINPGIPVEDVAVIPGAQAVVNLINDTRNRVLIGAQATVDYPINQLVNHADQLSVRIGQQVDQVGQNLLNRAIGQFDDHATAVINRSLARGGEVAQVLVDHAAHNFGDQATQLVAQVAQNADVVINNALEGFGERADALVDKAVGQVDERIQDLLGNVDERLQNTVDNVHERLNGSIKHTALLATGVIATGITTWYVSKFAWKALERYYGTPSLFVETSQKSAYQRLKELISNHKEKIPAMVFSPEKKQDLKRIIESTKNIRAKALAGNSHIKYRNLLLWGPPGTGKTMFAEKLAKSSGMEFRKMSGGDISKLAPSDALIALDEVFDYARKCDNGLMILIDEAESFLGERTNLKTDSPVYKLLTKFLSYTGTRSNKFMLVFATNYKDVLDEAMKDRIDESIEMKLPTHNEREGILKLYRKQYLLDSKFNSQEFIESVNQYLTDDKIKQMASQLKGFSGRNLEGIINSIKADADVSTSGLITAELIDSVIRRDLKKHADFLHKIAEPKQDQLDLAAAHVLLS
jgi:cytidylate kinase